MQNTNYTTLSKTLSVLTILTLVFYTVGAFPLSASAKQNHNDDKIHICHKDNNRDDNSWRDEEINLRDLNQHERNGDFRNDHPGDNNWCRNNHEGHENHGGGDNNLPPECNVNASQTIVSDTSTLKDNNPAALITTPYNLAWTASISGATTWIWGENPIVDPVGTTTETFTRTFNITGTPFGATLLIAADNSYDVSINGHAVGADATEFNYQSTGQDSYTIPAVNLVSGTNTITFTVTNWAMVGGTVDTNPAGLLYKLTVNNDECQTPVTPPVTQTGTISGQKFNDLDKDGLKDDGEPTLGGWNIWLDINHNGTYDGSDWQTTTDGTNNGLYRFVNVPVGTYDVCEIMDESHSGWTSTNPLCQSVTVVDGQTVTADFFNYENTNVTPIIGCMDDTANNYNSAATQDTNPTSCTYNPEPTLASVTTNGGGGGGGSNTGGHHHDIATISNSSGEVLGASTGPACGEYLKEYIKPGAENNPEEVKKLQMFLNQFFEVNNPVNGVYGPITQDMVNKFQVHENDAVLLPWTIAGFPTDGPTGYVYKTTKRWINILKCPESMASSPYPSLP